MKIALSILFLVLAFIIPLFYDGILDFFVVNLKSGWVFGSIYIRLIVIILFTVFLYLLFSLFERTRKIKFIFVLLISLLPGFGISFIKPIYDIDYGMFDDSMEIETAALSEATNGDFQFANERVVLAFFTTSCPHCKAASTKIGTNKAAGQKIQVHAFFPGNKEDTDQFLQDNNGEAFHPYLIGSEETFTNLGGFTYPSVFVVDGNGKTERHWTGDMINYTALDFLYDLEP
jgi:thiol-disulfide isomerase/thioredoxin